MKLTFKKGRGIAAAAMLGVAALALSACSATPAAETASGLESGLGSRAENRSAYFFTYYDPTGDAFWAQIQAGAEDAAALTNLDMTYQTAKGDSATMVDLVQASIAKDLQ